MLRKPAGKKAIRNLTSFPKTPSKPRFEGSPNERFTPNWDAIPGMGQRHNEVVSRYNRYLTEPASVHHTPKTRKG